MARWAKSLASTLQKCVGFNVVQAQRRYSSSGSPSDPKVNNPEGSGWIGKFRGPMMDHKKI